MPGFPIQQYVKVLGEDHAQDLLEYALVVALLACATVAGMSTIAGGINAAFSSVGAAIGAYTG